MLKYFYPFSCGRIALLCIHGEDYAMALIRCPECGKKISDQASACIHCGYPLPKSPTTTHVGFPLEEERNGLNKKLIVIGAAVGCSLIIIAVVLFGRTELSVPPAKAVENRLFRPTLPLDTTLFQAKHHTHLLARILATGRLRYAA